MNQAKDYVGQTVTIGAWVTNKRSSGKIAFLQLRDGKAYFQGIVVKADVSEETFELAKGLTQESSVFVTGVVQEDTRSKLGYELLVKDIELIGESHEYPITPKEHGTDFLMDHRHLWLRSTKQHAIMEIRNAIIYASYEFFDKNGFIKFDSPILSGNAAEDSTELFETDYFGDPAYLTQSGQLYLEAGAMAFGRVFDFGPVFRAEKSKTRRHLIEFWMIEAEMAFCNHDESLALQESFVNHLLTDVLEKCQEQLKVLGRDLEALENARGEFPRIKYKDAIQLLKDNGFDDIEYGDDFGSPHETFIANSYNKPVFITHWPLDIKPFYMIEDPNEPGVVLCADLIAPEGYGEIIGGSQRIDDYDKLLENIKKHDLNLDAYGWYLDLRKYGSVEHAGFGLGLERTVAWITGNGHVRETAPFPRLLNRLTP